MKILFILPAFAFLCTQASSQGIFQNIKAEVIYLDDYSNKLNNQIQLGDTINGILSYSQNVTDNNADTTVGDYWYYNEPYGIVLNVGGIVFQTDNTDVNFLCEAVNRPSVQDGDNVAFHSYTNHYSVGNDATDKVIAWQLDNPDGTNLNSDALPVIFDLTPWTQTFGLTINADDFPDGTTGFFIRATVFEIKDELGAGLNDLASEDQVRIFPNPASSFFKIEHCDPHSFMVIEDVNGKIRMVTKAVTSPVDISDFPSGLYVVKIIGEQSTKVLKLIKS